MIAEVKVMIECGKEKCVVNRKRCRFLSGSLVRDAMRCRLFDEVIYNYEGIFPEKTLQRCAACIESALKKEV